jgi:branched-subunit amino acid transport protein
MNTWQTWILLAAAGAITLTFRASFIVFANAERFPEWFRRALSFVPPAVIVALIVPGLVIPAGKDTLDLLQPRFAAGVIALAIAWTTRNMLVTLSAGMLSLWAIQWWVHV